MWLMRLCFLLALPLAVVLAGCAAVATEPARRVVVTPARAQEWRVGELYGLGGPYWTPPDSLVRRVERALLRELPSVSAPRREDGREGIDGYGIQYLGFTREGQRLVYANLFCERDPHPDPTRFWIWTLDGGGCFLSFVYDPATGRLRG